jgi:hypothetical protein
MTTRSIHKSSALADCRPKGGNESRSSRIPTTYAKVLYDLAKEVEGYDMTELREFCRWNLAQCREIRGFQSEVEFD